MVKESIQERIKVKRGPGPMCPARPHESIDYITKFVQNLKFVVPCNNAVEPTRHLYVLVTITVLNRMYRLQGMKQISEASGCCMKREQ